MNDNIEQLLIASFDGDLLRIEELICAGTDVNSIGVAGCSPLFCAIENDEIDSVKLLVEKGADVNLASGGCTPLDLAVDVSCDRIRQSREKMVEEPTAVIEFLLDNGADPASAIETATQYRSKKILDILACYQSRNSKN